MLEKLNATEVQEAIGRASLEYLTWDEFRKKTWLPTKPELLWPLIQFGRKILNVQLSIQDKTGAHYSLDRTRHAEFLHEVDFELGGNMLGIKGFGSESRQRIIRRNLIEESFASSKLEGANTSREAAKRLLREGRRPQDKSERMIVNNHAVMVSIEETLKDRKLTLELLLDLHSQVTAGTLSDPAQEGKLRETLDKNGKRLVIKPWDDETVAYVAPDKAFVEAQLPKLIDFANDEDGAFFIHPLIKGIILHFWIGLLHPFEDGNGRLARILFYWYMLRRGYWAFSYISLSERILKSPSQYAMAFINSEQDNFDLNYFVQYNVEKLQLARRQLQEYLKRKLAEEKALSKITQSQLGLNDRQTHLLHSLSKDADASTTPTEYQSYNPHISHMTVSKDLKHLVTKGLLRKIRNGKYVIYFPTSEVAKLFK